MPKPRYWGGILVVCMGFGFRIVNLLLMIITLGAGVWALKKNQGKDKRVTRYCSIGMGLLILSAILGVFIEGAPVDYFVKDVLFPVTESMGIKL